MKRYIKDQFYWELLGVCLSSFKYVTDFYIINLENLFSSDYRVKYIFWEGEGTVFNFFFLRLIDVYWWDIWYLVVYYTRDTSLFSGLLLIRYIDAGKEIYSYLNFMLIGLYY